MTNKTESFARAWGPYLIFFAAMLWATDAPFRFHLTKDLPTNFIVLGEHFFDIFFAVPLLFIHRRELRALSLRGWLAVVGIAVGGSALASLAFTEAFRYVNPSVAILLQKLQPLIAIGLAVFILKERLPRRFFLFAFLALFGAYLISFPNLVPQVYPGEIFNPNATGVLLALLAAFFWGASTVWGRYALRSISYLAMTSLRFIIAFLFLFFLNLFQGSLGAAGKASPRDWLFLLIIALASGVFSLLLYYRGLEFTKASVATLAELGFPLAAVLVNAVFIPGSLLVPMQAVGMAILLGALYFLARGNRREGLQESGLRV